MISSSKKKQCFNNSMDARKGSFSFALFYKEMLRKFSLFPWNYGKWLSTNQRAPTTNGIRFTRNTQNTRCFGKVLAGNPTGLLGPVAWLPVGRRSSSSQATSSSSSSSSLSSSSSSVVVIIIIIIINNSIPFSE